YASGREPIQATTANDGTARTLRVPAGRSRTSATPNGTAARTQKTTAAPAAHARAVYAQPTAACCSAASLKSGYSVIFWNPMPASPNSPAAQTTAAAGTPTRLPTMGPSGFRRASNAPYTMLTSSAGRRNAGAAMRQSDTTDAYSSP